MKAEPSRDSPKEPSAKPRSSKLNTVRSRLKDRFTLAPFRTIRKKKPLCAFHFAFFGPFSGNWMNDEAHDVPGFSPPFRPSSIQIIETQLGGVVV